MKGQLDSPRYASMPDAFKLGVQLHRTIDAYTDNHPVVREAIDRLQPSFHKFSGIVVDMYFDHFLAVNWPSYSSVSLEVYAAEFYELLRTMRGILPPSSLRMVDALIKGDWLSHYAHIEGIDWALRGIARRSVFQSGLERAAQELSLHYPIYEQAFSQFFPEVIETCNRFLIEHQFLPIQN